MLLVARWTLGTGVLYDHRVKREILVQMGSMHTLVLSDVICG